MGVIFSAMLSTIKGKGPGGPKGGDNVRRIREQRTLCGSDYMEVDFLWISEQQYRATARKKKELAS